MWLGCAKNFLMIFCRVVEMRLVKWLTAGIVIALVFPFLIMNLGIVVNLEMRPALTLEYWAPPRESKLGVVLGTSPENFIGGPNPYFFNRIHAAAGCIQSGYIEKLVLSGAGDEPEAMREALINLGVAEQALMLDQQGINTQTSMRNTNSIANGKPFVVISQAFHIERAIYLARREKIPALGGCVAEDPKNPIVMAREYLARVKAVFF
jgi:vancomycin permeability regulator SanA